MNYTPERGLWLARNALEDAPPGAKKVTAAFADRTAYYRIVEREDGERDVVLYAEYPK